MSDTNEICGGVTWRRRFAFLTEIRYNMRMQKVFVALSGGVDSAVTAALLREQGYDVTGVFIKIWQPEFIECTWEQDRLDAKRVTVSLGIPFETIDLSAEYQNTVISDLIREYSAGRTPNPDVLCNRFIKFGAFRDWAHEHGADLIATGHHARISTVGSEYHLLRGVDTGKDQAYFLWRLTQDDLAHTLMPAGEYQKDQVRRLARRYQLPVADRPDSQGLCFVGDVDMHDFLQRLLPSASGRVLASDGTEIGEHDGAALYTPGQRHKFRVTHPDYAGTPLYVANVDVATNTIAVSAERMHAATRLVTLEDVSWIAGYTPTAGQYTAEVRYHQKPQQCTVSYDGGEVSVVFGEPQLVAAGQSLVLYADDQCLGGGVIR